MDVLIFISSIPASTVNTELGRVFSDLSGFGPRWSALDAAMEEGIVGLVEALLGCLSRCLHPGPPAIHVAQRGAPIAAMLWP